MKRFLSLALAIIMVLSLIPVTTFAASPMPKVTFRDTAGTLDRRVGGGAEYVTWYLVFEEVKDETTGEIIGNKPVLAPEKPVTGYIENHFEEENNVLYMTFNNVSYTRYGTYDDNFITVAKNSNYTSAFDVVITLIGENKFSGRRTNMNFDTTGNITFTGSGSLEMDNSYESAAAIWSKGSGDLTFKDTNVKIYNV